MPVRVYRWTDPGAPPRLNNTGGSLIRVLRACLVDGYGDKQPAGWSMPFTDGNNPPQRAIFRQGAAAGKPRADIQVNDNSSGDSFRSVYVCGWDQASGLDAGTNRFPSSGTLLFSKWMANVYSAGWIVVADHRTAYLFNYDIPTYSSHRGVLGFGDYIHVLAGWQHAQFVWSYEPGADPASMPGAVKWVSPTNNVPVETRFGHDVWGNWGRPPSQGGGNYPSSVDGRIYPSRLYMRASTNYDTIGYLRGVYVSRNWMTTDNSAVLLFQRFDGVGPLSGKTFELWNSFNGALLVEISDTWEQ